MTQQVFDFGLLFACRRGELKLVRHAIEMGADVNTLESPAMGSLHSGIGHTERKFCNEIEERCEIVKLLVSKGADIELRNSESETPLGYAARQGMTEIVEFLMDQGANYLDVDDRHSNVVEIAYRDGFGDAAMIDMLKARDGMAELFFDAFTELDCGN